MALFRCGGDSKTEVKSITLSKTFSASNTKSVTWNMTGVSGYKDLVLYENLFPALPSFINECISGTSGGAKVTSSFSYTASTGTLTYTINSNASLGYGTGRTNTITVTVYYIQ